MQQRKENNLAQIYRQRIFKNITIINLLGLLLSGLFFTAVFILTLNNIEERLLNEGAKELISVINKKWFFLIHPERILFGISQLFPIIGLKLGLSLNSLIWLYSFNMLAIALLIYFICLLVFKDFYAGIYLCSFQIIGMGFNFYLYPFLEHIYGLLFCYLLYHFLKKLEKGEQKWMVVIIALIALITTIHPVCIIYIALLIFQSNITRNVKFMLVGFGGFMFLAALFYTEISINERANSMSLGSIPTLFQQFVQYYLDLIILTIVTIVLVMCSKYRWYLWPLFLASIVPYIFYAQFPLCYFMLPVGFSLLLFLTSETKRNRPAILVIITIVFAFNIYRIQQFKPVYVNILNNVILLLTKAETLGSSKIVLVRNQETELYFNNGLKFPLEESIKHSSLLLSSRKGVEHSLMIDSYDFTIEAFGKEIENGFKDSTKIAFVSSIYDKENDKTLYPKYFDQYEYCKYFFTNGNLNDNYFGISKEENYVLFTP